MKSAAGVESNVIFSPESYIPRSVSLNLTIDAFGQSINLFEMDSRFEGFERAVESMFGPGGRFLNNDLFGNFMQINDDDNKQRRKRDASNQQQQRSPLNSQKIDDMDRQFDAREHFPLDPEVGNLKFCY